MAETVRIEGLKELEVALRKLAPAIKGNPLRKAVRKMTVPFFDAAVANAKSIDNPETATNISDSMGIRIIPIAERDKYTAAGDSFEGYEVGPRKKSKGQLKGGAEGPQVKGAYKSAWYAHFVEFGTDKMTSRETGFHPFMRPALESTWRNCVDEFTEDLDKTLQRTVKRLAKKTQ